MRVLVTNDDGINAPGLSALQEIARAFTSDVWTVAPEVDQSGAAHSLTLRQPIRLRAVGENSYAVQGTPADCVIMGVRHILRDGPPTLVLSGVNRGANMAEDVTYSGTIAGAIEGTIMGFRSFAFSQTSAIGRPGGPPWHTAIRHGPRVIEKLLGHDWPEGVLMNVNFPEREPDAVEGIEVTRQGRREHARLSIDERFDTWGQAYYWLSYQHMHTQPKEGTDLHAVHHGRISVTPLSIDMTNGGLEEVLSATLR